MHFAALGALLLWVFLRHRDAYPRLRITVVLLTAVVPADPARAGRPAAAAARSTASSTSPQRYGQSVYGGAGIDSAVGDAVGPRRLGRAGRR